MQRDWKLYQPKELDICFVMISLDGNPAGFQTTGGSIRNNYPNASTLAVVPSSMHKEDVAGLRKKHPVVVAGDTVTSMFNQGIPEIDREWALVVVAGSWMRPNLDKKYGYFVDREDDILFPVVDRKWTFVDGSINGLMIRKETFKKVGPFQNSGPFEMCKLFWANDAVERGCRFKAVVGAQII